MNNQWAFNSALCTNLWVKGGCAYHNLYVLYCTLVVLGPAIVLAQDIQIWFRSTCIGCILHCLMYIAYSSVACGIQPCSHTAIFYCTLLYTTAQCCLLLRTTVYYCRLLYTTAHCCVLPHTSVYYCTLLYTSLLWCILLHTGTDLVPTHLMQIVSSNSLLTSHTWIPETNVVD